MTLVQNIIFASGETSNVFTVTIINDTIAESNESFEVFLKLLPGSTGVTIGQPSVATGIIIDDEVPGKTFVMSSGSVSRAIAYSVHIHSSYIRMYITIMLKLHCLLCLL